MFNQIYVSNVVRDVLLVIQKTTAQIVIHFISYPLTRPVYLALSIAFNAHQPQYAKIVMNIII